MPDENKLQALSDAGFVVKRTCLRCSHFEAGRGMWGTCRLNVYEHGKHTSTDTPRQASVPFDGCCSKHTMAPAMEALLRGHHRFLEPL